MKKSGRADQSIHPVAPGAVVPLPGTWAGLASTPALPSGFRFVAPDVRRPGLDGVFYAREVLRIAHRSSGRPSRKAEGHLLLGLTLRDYPARNNWRTSQPPPYGGTARQGTILPQCAGLSQNIANLHFGQNQTHGCAGLHGFDVQDSSPKRLQAVRSRPICTSLHEAPTNSGVKSIEDLASSRRPLHYIQNMALRCNWRTYAAENREKLIAAADARYTDLNKSRQIVEQGRQIETRKRTQKVGS
jgi:hypothetical protein